MPTMLARQMASARCLRVLFAALVSIVLIHPGNTQANIDGGRSDLPGMKQDIFDQVQKNKKMGGQQQRGKAPPECPKSDMMSPWYSLAYAGRDVYVRLDSTEGKCVKFISIGGQKLEDGTTTGAANYANLTNASKTCGPAGEWKRRVAENLSSMMFQGGFEWVKSENETIEVVTEEGTFQVSVNEEKYAAMLDCWKYACGCEQAKNPMAKGVMIALLVLAIGGISFDSIKVASAKIFGKKPPKHVECKNGHRMEEVKPADRHFCDICGDRGTTYQCSSNCNYDMCKKCYKSKKKEVKVEWEKWCEKHPEDKKKKKGDKDDDDKDDDAEKSGNEEKNSESGKDSGKEDSTKETSGGDEEKDDQTEPDSKAGDEEEKEEEKKEE